MSATSDPVILNPSRVIAPSAIVFGDLGNAPLAVSPDHPLPVHDRDQMSLIERLNREGEPFSTATTTTFSSFPAPTGAGTNMNNGIGSPSPGRALFVQSVNIWSTTPMSGRWQIGQSTWNTGVGTPPLMDVGFAASPYFQASFPVNAFARSSDKASVGATVQRWLDSAVSGTHYVGAGAAGFTLADSINFDARKVILFLGDSLWNGTGPTDVTTCIPWLINKFYRDAGVDCRYILKAYSGSTSSGHETFRQGGKYDFPQVDAIFYQLGTNDAATAMTTNASMSNIQAAIAWKQKRYPDTKLVIVGAPPVQNSTYEMALAALRAAEAAYIVALADPNVFFCDLGGSFNRATGVNYVVSDGSDGTRIHPADGASDKPQDQQHAERCRNPD